jgi:uncharacterized membrane protein
MENLARMMVASFELIEAEGRVLKQQLLRVGIAVGLGIIVTVLTITGLAFLIWGLFKMLAVATSPAMASIIFGLIILGTALVGGYIVRTLLVPPKASTEQSSVERDKQTASTLEEATQRADAHADRVPPGSSYAAVR